MIHLSPTDPFEHTPSNSFADQFDKAAKLVDTIVATLAKLNAKLKMDPSPPPYLHKLISGPGELKLILSEAPNGYSVSLEWTGSQWRPYVASGRLYDEKITNAQVKLLMTFDTIEPTISKFKDRIRLLAKDDDRRVMPQTAPSFLKPYVLAYNRYIDGKEKRNAINAAKSVPKGTLPIPTSQILRCAVTRQSRHNLIFYGLSGKATTSSKRAGSIHVLGTVPQALRFVPIINQVLHSIGVAPITDWYAAESTEYMPSVTVASGTNKDHSVVIQYRARIKQTSICCGKNFWPLSKFVAMSAHMQALVIKQSLGMP